MPITLDTNSRRALKRAAAAVGFSADAIDRHQDRIAAHLALDEGFPVVVDSAGAERTVTYDAPTGPTRRPVSLTELLLELQPRTESEEEDLIRAWTKAQLNALNCTGNLEWHAEGYRKHLAYQDGAVVVVNPDGKPRIVGDPPRGERFDELVNRLRHPAATPGQW